MATSKRASKAKSGAGPKTGKAGAGKRTLRDLEAKGSRKIRGGALQAYLYVSGQKQGDIK